MRVKCSQRNKVNLGEDWPHPEVLPVPPNLVRVKPLPWPQEETHL